MRILCMLFFMLCARLWAVSDLAIYADTLEANWANWSWDTAVNISVPSPVHSGTASLSARYDAAWAGVFLHTQLNVSGAQVEEIRFWLHGGTSGGQHINLVLYDGGGNPGPSAPLTATATSWTLHTIKVSDLGAPSAITGVVWQDATGGSQPTFYLDDITLVAKAGTEPSDGATTLAVDTNASRHQISPDIYGINFASESLATDLRLPVRRRGGNATTRYNWQNDTANHASDWYFENVPEDNPSPGLLPDGSEADRFVEQDRRTGARTVMTIPLIGWTPKARAYAGGFSIAKYGSQEDSDPWHPDFGNGVRTDGTTMVTGNDPADTSIAITPAFVQDWIAHLISRFGTAAGGGVAFYNLDNEPMLWSSTHRDVRPQRLGYDEICIRTWQYASAVKAADPGAKTLGPALWGWTAYLYSDLDAAPGGYWWNNPLDRLAHGDTPFVEWYLQKMGEYEQTTGTRILDYFDLHFYPQADGVALSGAGSAATQALRLRSTRALWDPTYVDESWIALPVQLIPRMHEWVQNNYPGTMLALGEYNWGALDNINGALTQADILGIFGREKLDMALLWAPPSHSDPGAFAFRMYRNYDGAGAAFGETSVHGVSSNQEELAVYAAERASDGALTIIVINKTDADRQTTLTLSGFLPAPMAEVYRYSAANLSAITRQADLPVTASGFSATCPAFSITLVVLPASAARVDDWTNY